MKAHLFILLFAILLIISCSENPTGPDKKTVLKSGEVIFISSDRDGNATNIFMMRTNGQIIKKITNYSWGQFVAAAISRDSSMLLFYEANPGLDIDVGMDIYIYKIKEDSIWGPITDGHPGNFSPDGKKFVFSRHTFELEGGFESVYLYDLSNNTETKLTEDGKTSFYPQLSPDGKSICYETAFFPQRDSIGCWQLLLMDIYGNYITNLTEKINSVSASNPIYTPDGKSIVCWYNDRTWIFDIVKINIESKDIKYLTTNYIDGRYDVSSNYKNPTVSKNGDKVYFYSFLTDYQYPQPVEIYSVNIDGSGLERVTINNFWDSHPVSGIVSYYIEE